MRCIFLILMSYFIMNSVFAEATGFKNNSEYGIRIWGQACDIAQDDSQSCTEEEYIGAVAPHQTLSISMDNKKSSPSFAKKSGLHITQAAIDESMPGFDRKALITKFPICNSIHEEHANSTLIFDIDPKTGGITCKNPMNAF